MWKKYYSNLLDENKNNIKEAWKILNTIINKKSKNSAYPQQFNDLNGNIITDEKLAANKFNDFFVNVGTNLASKIKVEDKCNIFNYLSASNKACMFWDPVDEKEVLTTINQCKNKTFEDHHNISMNVVKSIASRVIQPFSFICNLSFSTGAVPKNMKNC